MRRYITLGADKYGQVYGLELNDDGSWRRNSLGCSTSCVVIRPLSRENYEYRTKDPESARDLWQANVSEGMTELGLKEWFEEYVMSDDPFDRSWVFDLLDNEDNPTVAPFGKSDANDGLSRFREHLKKELLDSPDTSFTSEDDVYDWEASGGFSPREPFVVEFAPKDLLEEYYGHLLNTSKEFKL